MESEKETINKVLLCFQYGVIGAKVGGLHS